MKNIQIYCQHLFRFILSPKRILFVVISFFIFTVFSIVSLKPTIYAATGINQTINFQGKVVNKDGTNVADGQYSFVFKIYDAASGGANPWTETQSNVQVTAGIFRVALGSVTPISGVDFNTDNIYLGINFQSDGEMTPRIRFASVPYAFNAQKVAGLTVSDTTGTLTIPNSKTVQFGGAFTTSAQDLTLTLSGATTVTLPTTGTLATLAGVENLSNKTFTSTVTISGAAVDLTTGSNEALVIAPNGTGNVLINPSAGGQSALIINKEGFGDILSASSSGTTKFTIKSDGTASSAAGFTIDGVGGIQSTQNQTLTIGGGSTGFLVIGKTGQSTILPGFDCSASGNGGKLTTTAGGVLTCAADGGSSGGSNWTLGALGTLSPNNNTLDFLWGGASTTSAAFRIFGNTRTAGTSAAASVSANTSFAGLVIDNKGVGDIFTASSSGVTQLVLKNNGALGLGLASGTVPTAKLDVNGTASVSSQLAFRTGSGSIQTTANNTLNIGGNTTGDIQFLAGNKLGVYLRNNGDVGIGPGSSSPLASLDIRYNSANGGGIQAVASASGNTSFAALVVDNRSLVGDLFTASQSGMTQFVIKQNGRVGIGGTARIPTAQLDVAGTASVASALSFRNGVGLIQTTGNNTLTIGGGSTGFLVIGKTGQSTILPGFDCSASGNGGKLTTTAGGVLTCAADGGSSGGSNWTLGALGTLSPNNNTWDFLWGGNSTASAGFRLTGATRNYGTMPVASISANTSFAALVVDNRGGGDIFTASSSGLPRFTIRQNGDITGGNNGSAWTITSTGSAKMNAWEGGGLSETCSGTLDKIVWNATNKQFECSADVVGTGVEGADVILGTAALGNVTLANTSTYLNTVSATPVNNTGDIIVRANLWTRSLSATDQTITVEIRVASGGTCGGALLSSGTGTLVSASGANGPAVYAAYLDDNPGNTLQSYAVCALSTTNSGAAAGGLATAEVIDGGTAPGYAQTWDINSSNGTINPVNNTLDLLVGGVSTSTAKFAILNVANGNPTASVSSGINGTALSFDANGSIQTAKKQTLTIGGTTTGDVQFLAGNRLGLYLKSNGDIGLGAGSINPLASVDIRYNSANGGGVQAIASASGNTSYAGLVVDNRSTVGDLFTASQSGTTQFVIKNNGSVGIGGSARIPTAYLDVAGSASISGVLSFRTGAGSVQTTANNSLTVGGGSTGDLILGRASQTVLLPGFDCSGFDNAGKLTVTSGGVLTCDDDGGGATGAAGTWSIDPALGIHSPINNTLDLLIGGTSTQSAAFSVLGMAAANNPTASVSALTGANATKGLYMAGDGSLQSVRRNTLTIGGTTTGDIQFRPGNSSTSLYLASTGAVGFNSSFGISGQCLITAGSSTTPSWGGCTSGSNGNWWTLQSGQGTLYPINTTLDFLWGGTTTASASFRVAGATSNKGTVAAASISANTSFAGLVIDNKGTGALLTASSSGRTRFTIFNSGNVVIGDNPDSGFKLDVEGSVRIGNNSATDDIVKKTTTDWTVSGSSISTNDGVNTITTSGDQLKLVTDLIEAGATLTAPAAGATTGTNVTTGSVAFQRPDKKFVVFVGGAATSRIYDPVTNAWGSGPSTAGAVSLGSGSRSFQRQNGAFIVLHGGASTTTIYEPGGSTDLGSAVAGPPTSGTVGPGSVVIRRADGKFLVVHGNTSTTSSVYDPTACVVSNCATAVTNKTGSFEIGPATTGNVVIGSFSIPRPDGSWVVGLGGSTTTNIYDPAVTGGGSGGTFRAGPALTTGAPGAGTHVIQLPDNRFLVLIGGTSNTQVYDAISNTFSAGPTLATDTLGAGAHSFQRSDGKWVVVVGGNSKNLQLYDPTSGTSGSFSQLTGANGLQGATNAGAGSITFQRPDGKYVVVMGQTTQLTTVYDAGWNTTGTWTSEDILNTKISTYSAIMWSANPQSANNNARLDAPTLNFEVKTGDTLVSLGNQAYRTIEDNGGIIRAYGNSQYAKIKISFEAPIRSYPTGITSTIYQSNIWGGEANTFLRRSFIQPTVFNVRIQNPLVSYGDPSLLGDPALGRNFATGSAILEGVVTDNSNRLTLAINRNIPTATSSAGFIIASASANLGGTAAAGSHTLERSSGKFITILGGGTTTTRMYDSDTNSWSAGPTLPFAAGLGAHSFLMPDGRFFTVLGNTSINTAIFDPQANVFLAGPKLIGNAGTGANSFQRPDGTFLIVNGGATNLTNIVDPITLSVTKGPFLTANATAGSINIKRPDGWIFVMHGGATTSSRYDYVTNSFVAGPALTTGSTATGSVVVQLSNGRYWLKGATTVSQVYDPLVNTFAVGPTGSPAVAAGAIAIPRPDGRFIYASGATSVVVDAMTLTGALVVGPPMPCTMAIGGHVFQRPTGEYVVVCGNSASTAIIDAGWNLGGTYTTEPIQVPNLSSTTSLFWKNSGQGDIAVKYRTASSKSALGLASWKDANGTGAIQSSAGDTWFQARFDLTGFLYDQPGAKTRMWLTSDGGQTIYARQVQAPILKYWKLMNIQDPNVLTLTSGSDNVFRFASDGQAYTSENGAWNSGGADLAERYSSKESLQAGEVVTVDRLNSQHAKRSTIAYDQNVMGVVSTQPGFVAGAYTENSYPIALVGRVPVKVSTENGEIKAGDYLTSASIPGYAMKATVGGRVLGQAMEDMTPDLTDSCPTYGAGALTATTCGTITVFVNLTSYNGESVNVQMNENGYVLEEKDLPTIAGVDFATDTNAKRQQEMLGFLKTQKDNGQELYADRVAATQEIISPQIITDLLIAKKIKAESIEGLDIITNSIELLTDRVSSNSAIVSFTDKLSELSQNQAEFENKMASLSAKLDNMGAINLLNFVKNNDGSSKDIVTVENIAAFGTATFAQASVMDSLSVGNGMTITQSSINTLGSDLEIQSLAQGSVSFLGGAIIFDITGKAIFTEDVLFAKNVAVGGVLSAKTISTTDLQLGQGTTTILSDTEVESTSAAGLVILKKNNDRITINNPLVKENSFIFITPKTRTSQSLFLLNQVEGKDEEKSSFTVGTIDGNAREDIKFNYLIVN